MCNPFSWIISNSFPWIRQSVLTDCKSFPQIGQLFSRVASRSLEWHIVYTIRENELSNSRERITNAWERITNPWKQIAQFNFLKIPMSLQGFHKFYIPMMSFIIFFWSGLRKNYIYWVLWNDAIWNKSRLEVYHHVQEYKNVIFFSSSKFLFYIYNIQCLYKENKAFVYNKLYNTESLVSVMILSIKLL